MRQTSLASTARMRLISNKATTPSCQVQIIRSGGNGGETLNVSSTLANCLHSNKEREPDLTFTNPRVFYCTHPSGGLTCRLRSSPGCMQPRRYPSVLQCVQIRTDTGTCNQSALTFLSMLIQLRRQHENQERVNTGHKTPPSGTLILAPVKLRDERLGGFRFGAQRSTAL